MTANKIFFVSLGCDKNRIDSENMLGFLRDAGFSFVYDEFEADVIIINTCAFIDAAKEESIDTILEMAKLKETGKCKKLIVAGCLSERYADEILKELPEVDALLGVNELGKVVDIVSGPADENKKNDHIKKAKVSERVLTTEGFYEYLKIAEGCDKKCTYCIIPYIRGAYKSRKKEDILNEAKYLASQGVKELILVAQETTLYGNDIYGNIIFPDLLKDLCKIKDIEWIRILYAYPENINDELLNVMAGEEKLCNYLDMPVQHASDNILKLMGRSATKTQLIDIISRVREKVPDVAIRTSLITGFPGESDRDHEILMDFVKEMKFERLGVFTYSREEGTAAYGFPMQIDDNIKNKRHDEIMRVQKDISNKLLKKHINKCFDVIIQGKLPDEDIYAGRTYMDAPEVDGTFFVKTGRSLMSGDIIKAVAQDADDYDIFGVLKD